MKLCLGCMQTYDEKFDMCPYCGFVEGQEPELAIHMRPASMLKGENSTYTIGKVIGNGSFGVTYIAWDNMLERKVAIKEYLPSEYATRVAGQNSIAIFNEKNNQFSTGMEKFIDEARRLAKFENEEGIVKIFDHFYQNDTAYIVMEYLDGITLSEYMEENGLIEPELAVDMLMPVMKSLMNVHKAGIIHRDIAPDNIMITGDGSVKLIDFGASRYASTSHSKSLSVIVKQGYSPEEQYRRRGDQGPHTDVYSLAAVLYKMITGITPPDALERRAKLENEKKNILTSIRKTRKIPKTIENALYNALNIKIEDRTQNIEQFIEELTSEKPVKLRDQSIGLIDRLGWKRWQIISAGSAAAIVATFIILLATGVIHFTDPFEEEIILPDGMTRVPALVNQEKTEGEEMLYHAGLNLQIVNNNKSAVIPKDYIFSQSINAGSVVQKNTCIDVEISAGPEMTIVPSVEGINQQDAIGKITEAGLNYEITETYDITIEKGIVISQEEEAGTQIAKNETIHLVVSLGVDPDAEIEEKEVYIPDFVGMKYEEAVKLAKKEGIKLGECIKKTSSEEINTVIAQDIAPDTKVSNLTGVILTVSLGEEKCLVPYVMYLAEAESIQTLVDSGWTESDIELDYEENELVKEGHVISQSIESGEIVAAGTKIKLVVSSGRKSLDMPDVVGKSESAGTSELEGYGLIVNKSYAHDENVKSGNIISQSIAKGQKIKAGTSVDIVISTGEELFKVPSVLGNKESNAVKALENQNFEVIKIEAYSETVAEGCVISQSLAAGGEYKKGTQIVIEISKGKEPYTLTFDANGGSCSQKTGTIHYQDKYGTLPKASKTGYRFDGWYTAKSGGIKVTSDSSYEYRMDATLYALWTAETYTVTLSGNGGSDKGSVTVTYDSVYGALPGSARSNYTFAGWYTAKDGGHKIEADTAVTITGNQTLYAHWEKGKLTVTFDARGGTVSTESKIYTYGGQYSDLPTPAELQYYTFKGWYTEINGGGTKVTTGTTVTATGTQTLYAYWERNTLNVTYNVNGGNGSNGSTTLNQGEKYAFPSEPTRDYYTFAGWYTSASGGTKVTTDTTVTAAGTQTLYAYWERNTLNVTYNVNGGNGSNGSTTLNQGEKYAFPSEPTRDYYTFAGWYTSASGGTKVTANTMVTAAGTQTLYAQWTENAWTDWRETAPSGDYRIVAWKTQYRCFDKEWTTRLSSSLSGWHIDNSKTVVSRGTSQYVDWSTTPPPQADSSYYIDSQSRTVNRYRWYTYRCDGCYSVKKSHSANNPMYSYSANSGHDYAYLLSKDLSETENAGMIYYDDTEGLGYDRYKYTDGNYYYKGTDRYGNNYCYQVTEYAYNKVAKVYTYYFWKWKDTPTIGWQDTVITETPDRKVEKRTVYRYQKK